MSSSKGRQRANVRQYSAEDQALNQISAEAESRLAAKRAARAEAREIRMKEIEKQQKEVREYDSRRGSGDSTESDTTKDPKDRNYKQELRDLQDKFKNAMMTSAQLDNEKQSLVYQVELLKDQFEEHEEGYLELQREYKSKCSENGLVIITAESGEMSLQKDQSAIPSGSISTGAALLSAETIEILKKAGEGSLDEKLKRLAQEKKQLHTEIQKLKNDIEENKSKKSEDTSKVPVINGPEQQLYEVQREASKQIHDYKCKLQKADQDLATLEGTVNRLETQIKRYKTDSDASEKLEDELKTEKRRLQRELREAQTQVEELTNQNKHLVKRLEKIKQTRTQFGIPT
ncbi:hypothetical protein LOTGIDRAFT_238061 [Lottia gigantea]|uniref:Leucine-rich repeat flightless-interacting protein 2 n=1 Tax=Lottia gigantea TaxID=225164 RepID=V4ADZ1_LOTGI|nr:hypothetical protein LOTGIDRAFT_238061 [Lottia gigantea]ESP02234.1 hypothetical protein LOTGIDRAFT_238061 [Lottia gigantea]